MFDCITHTSRCRFLGKKGGKSRRGGESVRQRSGKAAIVQHVHLTFSAASPPKPISQRPAGERNALLLGKRGSQTTGRIKIVIIFRLHCLHTARFFALSAELKHPKMGVIYMAPQLVTTVKSDFDFD